MKNLIISMMVMVLFIGCYKRDRSEDNSGVAAVTGPSSQEVTPENCEVTIEGKSLICIFNGQSFEVKNCKSDLKKPKAFINCDVNASHTRITNCWVDDRLRCNFTDPKSKQKVSVILEECTVNPKTGFIACNL